MRRAINSNYYNLLLQSFFGRTYSNPGSVSECKNGGNCEINKKNRTSCKACRLKKCILAGMSKSSSRYGRRSNSFKATYASGHAQEDKQSEKPHIVPPFNLYPALLSRSCIGFDDESDAASTVQKNSTSHTNDVANSHRLFTHNWSASFQPQLSITPLSTSTQVASLPIDNQIQRQSPMQYHCPLPFLSESYQSLMLESQSRNTSDSDSSDDERLPDVEYKSSSNRVSPFTLTNKIDESTLSNSVSVNGSLMLMDTHNPYLSSLYSIPSMITPTAYTARGGDSLLVSPNPGGLADERDEPIDLSIRASSSLSQSNESSEKKKEEKEENQINDSDSSTEDCAVNPLDLTLDARPIIKSLISTSRS